MRTIVFRWGMGITGAMALAISAVASPLNLARVPANSAIVLHLDFDQLKKTEIGAMLLEQLQDPVVQEKMAEIIQLTGFDPRVDLQSLTAFAEARTDGNPVAAVWMEGKFDSERMIALVAEKPDYQKTNHRAITVHQWTNEKTGHPSFGAFPAPNLLLLSDGPETLQKALDVFAAQAPSLKAQPGNFPERILTPSPVLLATVVMDRIPVQNNRPPALQGGKSGSLTLSEIAGTVSLDVSLAFEAVEQAERLRAVVEGFTAMAAMNAEQNPEIAELAQRLEVSTEGATVSMKLRWSADKIKATLERAKERAQKNRNSIPLPEM